MADYESLSNNREDVDQEERKLSPWLQKRMEERAHPFASQGLFAGLTSSGVRNQPFQRLWERSDRLSKMGPAPAISQTTRQPFLSKAMIGIISRTIATGTSSLYKMLDLPWFRPGRSRREENTWNEGLVSRQEIDARANTGTPYSREPHPPVEPVNEIRVERENNIPEAYFDHISSPPITRKNVRSIGEHTPSPPVAKQIPARTENITRVFPSSDTSSDQYPGSGINRNIDMQVVDQRKVSEGHSTAPVETNETTLPSLPGKEDGYEKRLIPSDDNVRPTHNTQTDSSGKDASRTYPAKELFYQKPLRVARKIAKSLPFVKNNQNIQSRATSHSGSITPATGEKQSEQMESHKPLSLENAPVAREMPLVTQKTGGSSELADENNIETSDVSSEDPKEILHESRKVESEQGEQSASIENYRTGGSTGYPYRGIDLFDNKLPEVSRRVVPSPPSVENIPRKAVQPSESIQRSVDRPLPQQPIRRSNDWSLSRQPVRHRIDETLPQKPVESGGEGNVPQRSIRRHVDEKSVGEINRDGDEKSLRGSTQYDAGETSSQESIQFRTDGTQTGMNSGYHPENIKTEALYEGNVGSYRPMHKLPLTPQVINTMRTPTRREGIYNRGISSAIPEIGESVSHTLDLPLAPVSRIDVMRQEDDYLSSDPIQREPLTLQLRETAQTRQTTQTTQSTQTPTADTSQSSEVDSNEASTENKERQTTDYRTLAREIYPFIRRMIMIERERRPSR
ncbi:MAG: hypothetical protein JSU79_09180 [Dehalococcoidales bacterium]|nr:MAG: hypothetical protein JSU79_09180 [Dehalococcoidales bacterium]